MRLSFWSKAVEPLIESLLSAVMQEVNVLNALNSIVADAVPDAASDFNAGMACCQSQLGRDTS